MSFYLGILFLAIGGTMVLHIKYLDHKMRKSFSWPSVEGEITHSEMVQQCGGGPSATSSTTTFWADIKYRYQVRARTYLGDAVRVGIDAGTQDRNQAEERCVRYPINSKVTIYYNPDNPKEACLERIIDVPYFLYILAGAFGFFGLAMATGYMQVR
jgi:hypothetical protein